MHNLYAIFAKLLNICKQIAGNLVNESGNVPRRGVVPKFSDLEVFPDGVVSANGFIFLFTAKNSFTAFLHLQNGKQTFRSE